MTRFTVVVLVASLVVWPVWAAPVSGTGGGVPAVDTPEPVWADDTVPRPTDGKAAMGIQGPTLGSGSPPDGGVAFDANERPLADAGLDQSVRVNASVQLDAGGSRDPDGSVVGYAWNITAPDGTQVTPACATCVRTNFTARQVGTYEVQVVVTDDDGATATDTLYVGVSDYEPPDVDLSGPTSATSGDSPTYTATVTPGTEAVERVVWTVDGRVVVDRPLAETTDSASITFSGAGSRTVAVTVYDAGTPPGTTTDTMTVTVDPVPSDGGGTPPTAAIAVNRSDPTPGDPIGLDAGGSSDPDGSVVAYEWSIGGGERTGRQTVYRPADAGTYTVTLTVTDDDGNTGTTTRDLSVESSPSGDEGSCTGPATATVEGYSPGSPVTGQTVTVEGNNTGCVDDVTWEFEGSPATDTGATTATATWATPGTYTVTYTAVDESGPDDSDTVTVTVGCSTPTAFIDGMVPSDPVAGESVTLLGSASGCNVTGAWTVEGTTPNATGDYLAVVEWPTPGEYEVTYAVTDETGATNETTVTVAVGATCTDPVTAAIEGYGPGTPAPNESVTVTANATGCDPSVGWSVEGTTPTATTDTSATVRWPAPGNYTVTYGATDGGRTRTATVTIPVRESDGETDGDGGDTSLLRSFHVDGPTEVAAVLDGDEGSIEFVPDAAHYVVDSEAANWQFYRGRYDRFDLEIRDRRNDLLYAQEAIAVNQSIDWASVLEADTEAVTMTVRGVRGNRTRAASLTVNVCRAFSYESCVGTDDAPDYPPPGVSVDCTSTEIEYGQRTHCATDYEKEWAWDLRGSYRWSKNHDVGDLSPYGRRGGLDLDHRVEFDTTETGATESTQYVTVKATATFDFREDNVDVEDPGSREFFETQEITVRGTENGNNGGDGDCGRDCGGAPIEG